MLRGIVTVFACLATVSALAAGGGYKPVSAKVNLDDQASLQRGAKLFVNYCLSCHSANFMRYNRVGADLDLTDEQVIDNLMFASDKIGNTMGISMASSDAESWFGVLPPDLSVVSRSRGPDWLYTYLMTFYRDESRPFGVNNLMFPSVGMPHVFERLQGIQQLKAGDTHGSTNPLDALELAEPGSRSAAKFSKDMRDLVNYLVYLGEPAKLERYDLGMKVIAFLLLLTFLTRALYKEYWRDVH
jgi:ubiquinol-cytochrome c reductase cytochrome c1 subunit